MLDGEFWARGKKFAIKKEWFLVLLLLIKEGLIIVLWNLVELNSRWILYILSLLIPL